MPEDAAGIYRFGQFLLDPRRRILSANGVSLDIGGRAFDVLLTLVEARSQLVTKGELMDRVWPNVVVDDNTLQFQISTLRRILGDSRSLIKTVSGRGYVLVADVSLEDPVVPLFGEQRFTSPPDAAKPNNIPPARSELIGRKEVVSAVVEMLAKYRLVTLVGMGGIGKTRIATAVAREVLAGFRDGVWLIELDTLSDPELLPSAIATTLGLEVKGGQNSARAVASMLTGRQILLVMDNCEHLIDAATIAAEELLDAGADIRVLATSREPLRSEDEHVYRVPALDLPDDVDSSVEQMLACSAIKLFVVRAQATDQIFLLTPQLVPAIARICRSLDGTPLAIELAAARATSLGIDVLEAALDNRLQLLAGGRRTAVPRQQTLQATLDWSYDLLTESERLVLNRISIFVGDFSLEGVRRVAVGDGVIDSAVMASLGNLVVKSLVSVDVASGRSYYRLLETTRVYARERLTESAELDLMSRNHTKYLVEFYQGTDREDNTPNSEKFDLCRRDIDNIRAALDWALSQKGDIKLGIALTIAALPIWDLLNLAAERRDRIERCLAALASNPDLDKQGEATLRIELWTSVLHTEGPTALCEISLREGLAIARSLKDNALEVDALWGLSLYKLVTSDLKGGLLLVREITEIASRRSSSLEMVVGHRSAGLILRTSGEYLTARDELERAITLYEPHPGEIRRFRFNNLVAAYTDLAVVLWRLGFPDQAVRAAYTGIAVALRANHPASLGYALNFGSIDLFFRIGDLPELERLVGMARELTVRRAYFAPLSDYEKWHIYQQGLLAILRGEVENSLELLSEHRKLLEGLPVAHRLSVLMLLSRACGLLNQVDIGLVRIGEAIDQADQTGQALLPELLRVKGELLLAQPTAGASVEAEGYLQRSIAIARRQSALSVELRSSSVLATLMRRDGRQSEALALITSVYNRFTEGFETADLRAAKSLIDELRRQ